MKKLTLLFAFAAFALATPKAEAQTFEKGTNVLNVTVGFGSGVYNGAGYSVSPAFAGSFEHCFWDDLINGDFSVGIGGYLGFQTSKYEANYFGGSYGWRYTTFAPAARGTFHWTYVENLDLYAGVHAGFKIVTAKETGTQPGGVESDSGGPLFAPFVGARYYFTDMFGVCAEIGSGVSYMNVGVALKL